jgi:hypothetical protein
LLYFNFIETDKLESLSCETCWPMQVKRGQSTAAQKVLLDCQMKVESVCLGANILNPSKSLQDRDTILGPIFTAVTFAIL